MTTPEEAVTAIALRLKWRKSDVRTLIAELELDGVHVSYVPTTGELCPCGYHYATDSGLCVKCETDREVERQKERDEAERERLERLRERQLNVVKTARKRMRAPLLANPRDENAKAILAAVDEFIRLIEGDDEGLEAEAEAAARAAMQ